MGKVYFVILLILFLIKTTIKNIAEVATTVVDTVGKVGTTTLDIVRS